MTLLHLEKEILEKQIEELRVELHKERCLRIKAENELAEKISEFTRKITDLEYQLNLTKRNWWKKFRLPKIVWRDYDDDYY